MALEIGSRIGHYEVTALIGEGGMGQVFRATDAKLNREVALKVLPGAFASHPDRLARFRREAQLLASLNHRGIAAIYGIEGADDTPALVLELVEGPTLADRLAQGPIPSVEALPIASQIAEALEAAHEQGIIHRDLKPANIKLKPDGTVKVLDFGLAKALKEDVAGNSSESPTLTAAATASGVLMGTAAYMSPEQATGKTLDRRTDVWALGCVLYEMLTGRRPFEGDSVSEVLAEVLRSEPSWDVLPRDLPPAVAIYLKRCLHKNPGERVRDIGDVRLALSGAFDSGTAGQETPPETAPAVGRLPVWRRRAGMALALAGAVAVASLAFWSSTRSEVTRPDPIRLTLVPPDTAPLVSGRFLPTLTISPDGRHVVYVARELDGANKGGLILRPIDQLVSTPLRGGEGGRAPFLSPDGEWIGFLGGSDARILHKVSVRGGAPITLAVSPLNIVGTTWSTDDQIIYGTLSGGLFRVSAAGGESERLTSLDAGQGETSHRWPSVIPSRKAVVFVSSRGPTLKSGELAVLDLETREVTRLGLAGVSPHYVSTGHLIYAAENGSLLAVPFDATSLDVTANPVPLVDGIRVYGSGAADFSISDDGRLVYVPDAGGERVPRQLVWVDREGQEESLSDNLQPDHYVYPRFSPDGTRVAIAVAATDELNSFSDLWVLDLARGSRSRVTFGEGNYRFFPVWSPDGSRLAFANGTGGTNRLLVAPADGGGAVQILLDRRERQFPTSWAADGHGLAIYLDRPNTARDLAVLQLDDAQTLVPFVTTPFQERAAMFSPNGRFLAYVSDESGQDEVYVRPYPGPGRQHTISADGGSELIWSRAGDELFYRNRDQMFVVGVDASESFRATVPEPLFAGSYDRDNSGGTGGVANYDIAPDGERFLMVKKDSVSGGSARGEINVVLNWFQELTERVPVP